MYASWREWQKPSVVELPWTESGGHPKWCKLGQCCDVECDLQMTLRELIWPDCMLSTGLCKQSISGGVGTGLQGELHGMGSHINAVQCGAVIRSSFSPNSSHKTAHSSPVRASYGVSFVSPTSDLYSVPIPGSMYALSCYIVLFDTALGHTYTKWFQTMKDHLVQWSIFDMVIWAYKWIIFVVNSHPV